MRQAEVLLSGVAVCSFGVSRPAQPMVSHQGSCVSPDRQLNAGLGRDG